MTEQMVSSGFTSRCQKVLEVAKDLHARKPDWVTFFRETLGVSGAARSVFPEQADYAIFEKSQEFSEIQQLVASLRDRKPANVKNEATRVITVRLPESLHESLKAEAADHSTSMNKLCISKLLQKLVEEEEARKSAASAHAPTTLPQGQQPAGFQRSDASRSEPVREERSGFRSTYEG